MPPFQPCWWIKKTSGVENMQQSSHVSYFRPIISDTNPKRKVTAFTGFKTRIIHIIFTCKKIQTNKKKHNFMNFFIEEVHHNIQKAKTSLDHQNSTRTPFSSLQSYCADSEVDLWSGVSSFECHPSVDLKHCFAFPFGKWARKTTNNNNTTEVLHHSWSGNCART